MWGVNGADHIFKRPADGSGRWKHVPGLLKHVTAINNSYIWGVNKHDAIFKCKKPCNGRWIHVPGHLKQIDGGQAYIYGVNKFDDIFARPVDGRGGWRHIPGKLKHVTASRKSEIFGVNAHNDIFESGNMYLVS